LTVLDRSAPGVRIGWLRDERASEAEPLDLAGRIISVSFEDSERRADKLSLQLDNFDLSLFERPELAGGAILQVSWGYPGHMSPPRRLVVRSMKGFQTLTIEAQALSALMNRQAHTRTWIGVTRSQVARAIAEEHGYEGAFIDVEDTQEVYDTIAQAAETDARFLRRLAAREEFEFYVDDGGFHFHERRLSAAPTHVFTWFADPGRGDVISVDVESDLVRRAGRVTVRGRDPVERANIEESATNENTERSTLADIIAMIDPDSGAESRQQRTNATASVRPTTARTEPEARREARARFLRAERATVKLGLRVVGDPTLHAKSIVEVRGISALLSGLYYVTEVKHTIDASGYVSEVKATRDGTGRRARALAQERRGPPRRQPDDEREHGGERNRAQSPQNGVLRRFQRVDGETGREVTEYRPSPAIGANDPEGRR
jgi:phage protein D